MYSANIFSLTLWWRYLCRILGSLIPPSPIKNFFYRLGGIAVGKNVFIGYGVYFVDGFKDSLIVLADESVLSPRVTLVAMAFPGDSFLGRDYPVTKTGRVFVGEGAWIGVGAVVLPGVTLGRGCIVGANAVINQSIGELEVWVGVPGRKLKKLQKSG